MISIALSEKYLEKTLHDLHYFRATAEKMKKPNLPTDRDGKPRVLTSSEKPRNDWKLDELAIHHKQEISHDHFRNGCADIDV